MPRRANTCQISSTWVPPEATTSAWMMALRMSRNDGSGGESSMPRVTRRSDTFVPIAVRRSHSACTQISPSAWTSGNPMISPRSP